MSALHAWLVMVPVLLPLVAGALLILLRGRRHGLKLTVNLGSTVILLGVAMALAQLADAPGADAPLVHLAANWPAPFGIVLAADRLSAAMLLLTALLALAALLYAFPLWGRVGVHFHALFQFLLMGINGTFLTGDIFNLFVFFEVMLAASYGLLLYSANLPRIRAGMHYIAVNLVGSSFFLIGVALIHAGAGTLNMADLAMRMAELDPDGRRLVETGAAVLAIAFFAKCAAWPFCFWLPAAYASAPPPVGAMLALMTKVGFYALLRVWALVFGAGAGLSAGFGGEVLLGLGLATLLFGSFGLLASQDLGKVAGYSAIVSSGILLAVLGLGQPALTGAALYYLVSSSLALAALLLLAELIQRLQDPAAAMLAVTMEAFGMEDPPGETEGAVIPAGPAFLGLCFFFAALVATGMPPLSGFVAKFGMLHGLLQGGAVPLVGWLLLILIIGSGLAGIISMMRFGVRAFWATAADTVRLRASEATAVSVLLLLTVLITVRAAPVFGYLERASDALHMPRGYVSGVLAAPVVPGPAEEAP